MEVLEERYILLHEVEELLRERYLKNEVDNFQRKAYEHAKKMIKLEKEKALEMVEELKKLNESKLNKKLRDVDIIKIVEILPLSLTELRAVLLQNRMDFKKEELEEILKIVEKYAKA